jgi:hypothetical protein
VADTPALPGLYQLRSSLALDHECGVREEALASLISPLQL